MTTKFNELSLLSTNLDFDNHGGPYKNKTYTEIMKFLLLEKPTFLALQEVGDNGNGLKIKELEFVLKKHGYNMVFPEMDGIKPVNTRLFYDSNIVKFVKISYLFMKQDLSIDKVGLSLKLRIIKIPWLYFLFTSPFMESFQRKKNKCGIHTFSLLLKLAKPMTTLFWQEISMKA